MARAQSQLHRKRKRDDLAPSLSSQGRGLRKLAALFGEFSTIVVEAEAYAENPFEEYDIDETRIDLSPEEEKYLDDKRRRVSSVAFLSRADMSCDSAERNYEAYLQIHRQIPSLKSQAAMLAETNELVPFLTSIQKGANDARSEDFRRVTASMGNWINQDHDLPELQVFDHSPLTEQIDKDGERILIKQRGPLLTSDRSTRGVQDDICDGLLVRRAIRDGTKPLGLSYFSRIFYRGFQGDPDKVEEGFLKSRYLVKSYKVVFTAPSSADKVDDENNPPAKRLRPGKAIRKPVADLLGMNGKVSPRSLGYIGILVYASLTSNSSWSSEYCKVSLPQMYEFIVDFFEAPKVGTNARARADALLTWWNKQIFPNHASSAATHPTTISSRAQLRAQRAAMEDEEE
ncbi:hypothetical protein C8R44DRAFT_880154 [Mycena epipterygia]|nr:hypothetical protein C8R44DRAFT_880154 [Mycena epipterygia]